MKVSLLRTDKEITEIYERHVQTVWRVCYAYMKNTAETEDAVQDTFLRLMDANPSFESAEHEKAWLIRTASNVCKNHLKRKWRKRENLDSAENTVGEMMQTNEVLDAVLALPDKYKTVVYLYYYEGYAGKEIGTILKKPASTVRNLLRDARKQLKEKLGEDFCEE